MESDLHLAAKTLDEAPWKAQVTAHLDEVSLGSCGRLPSARGFELRRSTAELEPPLQVLTKVQELETSPKEEAPAKRKTKARADEAPAKKAKARAFCRYLCAG